MTSTDIFAYYVTANFLALALVACFWACVSSEYCNCCDGPMDEPVAVPTTEMCENPVSPDEDALRVPAGTEDPVTVEYIPPQGCV